MVHRLGRSSHGIVLGRTVWGVPCCRYLTFSIVHRATAHAAMQQQCAALAAEIGRLKQAVDAKAAEVGKLRDYVSTTAQRCTAAEAEVALLKAEVAGLREGKRKDEEEKEALRKDWWKSAEDYR